MKGGLEICVNLIKSAFICVLKFMEQEIVVSGIGAVTPLGLDAGTTWKNLTGGVSAIKRRRGFLLAAVWVLLDRLSPSGILRYS